MKWIRSRAWTVLVLLLTLCVLLSGCAQAPSGSDRDEPDGTSKQSETQLTVSGFASIEGIPDYSGKAYVVLNNNQPTFTKEEIKTTSYEFYSELDSLGRCGVTHACVGEDIMPTEDRESISSVKPSGWVNNKYDSDLVDGGYLYNRCHLIGFQLTGENANKQNLITGTRYLNIEGMLPFENMIADYVKETGNHVMFRVTPKYAGNNLLASGVQMEAWSVEDDGEGVCFNVFAYNVQPGIAINYATGENWLSGETPAETTDTQASTTGNETKDYILNTKTKKFHLPTCSSAAQTAETNKQSYTGTRQSLIDDGYAPCGTCKP
ncbi:MAG: DNA/RNA non-specific endonuclease [Clostridia bacterium]|nr:DNA/RNA non-specific endonuclease [Clostridia bacterium]